MGGITPDSIGAFFKGTGILGSVALLIFLLIKYKVVRVVSVDQATEWIRAKWGVAQYYRFGKRRGRLVRMQAGRHLIIRGIYDGWEICKKDIPLVYSNLSQPFCGRMLQFDRLTITYRVVTTDSPKGDKLMLRSFLSVRNPDRTNQVSAALDDKVLSITLMGLGEHLKQAPADEYNLPVISADEWRSLVAKKLRKEHGVRLTGIELTAPTWLPGEQQYRAGKIIAKALRSGARQEVLPILTPPDLRAVDDAG